VIWRSCSSAAGKFALQLSNIQYTESNYVGFRVSHKKHTVTNPWQILSTKEIYKNEWMRLREDQVITPGGKRGIYGVVETSPAIGIVPITETLEIFLVGQYRYTLDTYSWEIPEGGAEHGESNLEAAKRELKEETGLNSEKWTELGTLYTSNSITNEIGYLFLAENLIQGISDPEHTEDLAIKKVPLLEAYKMVLKYEIKDSLAIIGIMRAYEYLDKEGRLLR
jgi:8-oxo-dGTP pyrophosphatase MutT (NUDIX family)